MIDLRTDALLPPTEEMWAAMRAASLGWATYGEDEQVLELEARGAALLGKDAALLAPTCSLANLAAVLALTEPGERVRVDADAHIVVNEGDWLREVARLEVGEPAAVVCLENTHTRRGGTVLTTAETAELASRAPRSHLDGARLANAAVALGVPVADLAAPVDTVAFALNKGLGAPFGALLAGGTDVIARARVHLKTLGGATIHKAGLFAAAALVALDGIDRLAEDHRRARDLARLIGADEPQTSIVLADLGPGAVEQLSAQGVLVWPVDGGRVRFVTHKGISDDDVATAAQAVSSGSGISHTEAIG